MSDTWLAELDEIEAELRNLFPDGVPAFTLDDALRLVASAKEVRPPDGTARPSVLLDSYEIVVSDVIPPGLLLPLGPRSYVISRVDFDHARKGAAP